MNIAYWGGLTSGVVAFFLEQSSAEACATAGDCEEIFDRKYITETQKVLREIGFDHPIFVIGESVVKFM